MAPPTPAFPPLRVKAADDVGLEAVLPGQIYTLDDLLDPAECGQMLKWAKSLPLEAPKPAKKGEAERTACAWLLFPSSDQSFFIGRG